MPWSRRFGLEGILSGEAGEDPSSGDKGFILKGSDRTALERAFGQVLPGARATRRIQSRSISAWKESVCLTRR